MNGFLKKTPLQTFLRLTWFFFASISAGAALIYYPGSWHGVRLAHGFSDGLVVAGVIGLGVELFAATVLIKHVTDDLAFRLIGYGLPEAAQTLVSKLIRETKLVYRRYEIRYRITKSGIGRVKARLTVSYTVVNNGTRAHSYEPRLSEERFYDPQFSSLEFGGKMFRELLPTRGPKTGAVTWRPGETRDLKPSSATDNVDSLDNNGVCKVRWEYTIEAPENYGALVAFTGVTLDPRIELEELPDEFEFCASEAPDDDCLHAIEGSTWEYKRAFVGGQHLRVWWRPK